MLGPSCEEVAEFQIFRPILSAGAGSICSGQFALAQSPTDGQSRTEFGASGLEHKAKKEEDIYPFVS